VTRHLKANDLIGNIDKLLVVEKDETYSAYQKIKQSPKAPTITNFKEHINHHTWLMSLGSMELYLKDITKVKLKQFGEEAKSLDVDNLKDLSDYKKYTLIACLLHQAQQTTKDALGVFVCKALFSAHKRARKKLEILKTQFDDKTQDLAKLMLGVLTDYKEAPRQTRAFVSKFKKKVDDQGGIDQVTDTCQKIIAYNSKNHIPFLWHYFRGKRSALFDLLNTIQICSSTQNSNIIRALNFSTDNRHRRSDFLSVNPDIDLSFASEKWKNFIYVGKPEDNVINRRYFELCVFSYLTNELRSGDIFIEGADAFSDYRQHLLSWEECDLLVEDYLQELNFPKNAEEFVAFLKNNLLQMARKVDKLYPNLSDFMIDENGVPVLKRVPTLKPNKKTLKLVEKIHKRMPERSLLDTLCLTHHLTGWAHEFGHISGADSRLDNPIERYILNVFCQGTGMGPSQGAKHIKNSTITPHMLSWVNRRHVTPKQLNKSKDKIINYSQQFLLTTAWGDGRRCAADGTLRNIYEDNLVAESHFRYNAKGGIAYNHISDTYVALFSTFIPCGVWEAVEIIESLLKNESSIKPDTVHADTQGQSTVVFGLSYLLGIKLMPRIRNWKDLTSFRPSKEKYKNIDSLFGDEIDWNLIKTHWKDLLQVILSIKQGKISSSFLLRKLTNYSRKNRLYNALRELGRVIRTQFLLEYISNIKLREIITASTNKVEAYNALSDWIMFGSRVIVASNDPDEMEKAIKYNALIANCIVLQNIIDYSYVIYQLQQEAHEITKEDASRISPYMTEHLKRFGDFIIDLEKLPENTEMIKNARLF
jgi:TnpA family transposase